MVITCGLDVYDLYRDVSGVPLEDLTEPGVQVIRVGGNPGGRRLNFDPRFVEQGLNLTCR
jgi:hypothetical protein